MQQERSSDSTQETAAAVSASEENPEEQPDQQDTDEDLGDDQEACDVVELIAQLVAHFEHSNHYDTVKKTLEMVKMAGTTNDPSHAAAALIALSIVQHPCPTVSKVLKLAVRAVRDRVIDLVYLRWQNKKDREEFDALLVAAFGRELHKEERAQMHAAWHKDPRSPEGFISNNEFLALRRTLFCP